MRGCNGAFSSLPRGFALARKLIGQAEDAPTQPQTELMVEAWSTAEGLPHASVTALAQTRDGYLWIGTLELLGEGRRGNLCFGLYPEGFVKAMRTNIERK